MRYAKLFPRARFFLFEPLPSNQKAIRSKLSVHRRINASFHGVALSDSDGEALFHVSSGISPFDNQVGNKSSSLLKPGKLPDQFQWIQFREQIKVPTVRLENFCQNHGIKRIDYVHMDVQGAELRVLHGAGVKISDIGLIWMEVSFKPAYEDQPVEAQATEWMRTKGFRKVIQISYGEEGDALYLNMRRRGAWLRLFLLKVLLRMGRIRILSS